jgi:decaprenyl-phosphate phosphoribosyltransferase
MKYFKLIRLSQWIKNLLIFLPLLATGEFTFNQILELSYVFIGFSIIVSSTYIYNDFIDIDSDKKHPDKKNRPIASGQISESLGYIILISLFAIGNFILFIKSNSLLIFSAIYVSLTLMYSFKLKYIKYIDIVIVSTLFILRVLLGSEASNIKTSIPLILFIFFISLGIAAGKKLSILNNIKITNSKVKNHLKESYSEIELLKIIESSFYISLMTYTVWIIFLKSLFFTSISSIALVISCICLYFFNNIFIEKSKIGLTEEIIEITQSDNELLTATLMFLLFSGIGLLS